MSKRIEQARYYQQRDERNQPSNATMNKFISGSVFKYPITQLGIQSLPGVKFYLNHSTTPIVLGYTGIYDLELDGITEINHLAFAAESMNLINTNAQSFLIVDYIYESEGHE